MDAVDERNMVECRGLSKVYRQGRVDVSALKEVDLDIGAGEFLALAGPSGSGKTTLLNLIGALDTPTTGRVRVDGCDLGGMSRAELAGLRLRRLGFVFQAYNLIPVLSARENVEFILELQGVEAEERRRRSREILDGVGLEGLHDRRPHELSGGQQQRVAVARALVGRPGLVLADEPTANLDSATGSSLLEMMRQMNGESGVTFVFSTHDPMVMRFARRLVHLKDGRVTGDEVRE
jgi:putative ABC transport system ATP-binding protein